MERGDSSRGCTDDPFDRTDHRFSSRLPFPRDPGLFPRWTPQHTPGVSGPRSAGPSARTGPGSSPPGFSAGSDFARPLRPALFSRHCARPTPPADPCHQAAARRPSARHPATHAGAPADPAAGAEAGDCPAAGGKFICAAVEFHAQATRQRAAAARTCPEEDGVVLQHELRRSSHPRRSRSPRDRSTGLHPRHRPLLRPRPVQPPVDAGPATARSRVDPRVAAACRPGAQPAGRRGGRGAGPGARGRGGANGAAGRVGLRTRPGEAIGNGSGSGSGRRISAGEWSWSEQGRRERLDLAGTVPGS